MEEVRDKILLISHYLTNICERIECTEPRIHNLGIGWRWLASSHSRPAVGLRSVGTDRVGPELVWLSWRRGNLAGNLVLSSNPYSTTLIVYTQRVKSPSNPISVRYRLEGKLP